MLQVTFTDVDGSTAELGHGVKTVRKGGVVWESPLAFPCAEGTEGVLDVNGLRHPIIWRRPVRVAVASGSTPRVHVDYTQVGPAY